MIRRLIALVTGRIVVATQDHDGAVRFRLAWRDPFGNLQSRGICHRITLFDDGSVKGVSYIHRWVLIYPRLAPKPTAVTE